MMKLTNYNDREWDCPEHLAYFDDRNRCFGCNRVMSEEECDLCEDCQEDEAEEAKAL